MPKGRAPLFIFCEICVNQRTVDRSELKDRLCLSVRACPASPDRADKDLIHILTTKKVDIWLKCR